MAISTKYKDPTPEEIRQRCLEIQAEWKEEDFILRGVTRARSETADIRGERPEERKRLL